MYRSDGGVHAQLYVWILRSAHADNDEGPLIQKTWCIRKLHEHVFIGFAG
eukprot:m.212209 g.212209  ORF g.212209 m.212209 type:complete len:50 (+) comp19037_c0_seq8:226-375(+)